MFSNKVTVSFMVVVLVTMSQCEPPSTNYGVPFNSFSNQGNFGNHHAHEGQDPDHLEPKSYEFGYAVKDEYTGNDYKRRESSDGNQVQGEYRVQLPDGRTQIVTYYADWQTGFHADVRYEGTAQYPDQYPNGNYQGLNNQYGPPNYNNNNNNNPASSSVTIKDFSGPGTAYNTNQNYNNYDTYANGNFGNRYKPAPVYGAP